MDVGEKVIKSPKPMWHVRARRNTTEKSRNHRVLAPVVITFLLMMTVQSWEGKDSIASNALYANQTDCLTNGLRLVQVPSTLKIALIKPVFTATPYSQYAFGSFYAFYHKYGMVNGNITTNLDWLNTSVSSGMRYNSGWGHSLGLYSFLTSQNAQRCGLNLGKNLFILSDINVSDGALFYKNGSPKFDVVVVGFSEYTTLNQYDAYKQFVASGGKLILMSSDNFEVRVDYSHATNHESLVRGHGWLFNGKSAWHDPWNASSSDPWNPWNVDEINWIGSTLCCFHRFNYNGAAVNQSNPMGALLQRMFGHKVFTSYQSHEENAIRNMSHTQIVATFINKSGTLVASYVHEYKKGTVVSLSVFGTDIVSYDKSVQSFVFLAMTYNSTASFTSTITTTTSQTLANSTTHTLTSTQTLTPTHTLSSAQANAYPWDIGRTSLLIVTTAITTLGLLWIRKSKQI